MIFQNHNGLDFIYAKFPNINMMHLNDEICTYKIASCNASCTICLFFIRCTQILIHAKSEIIRNMLQKEEKTVYLYLNDIILNCTILHYCTLMPLLHNKRISVINLAVVYDLSRLQSNDYNLIG